MRRVKFPHRKKPPSHARNMTAFKPTSAIIIDDSMLHNYEITIDEEKMFYVAFIKPGYAIVKINRTRVKGSMTYHVFSIHNVEFEDKDEAERLVNALNSEVKQVISESRMMINKTNTMPANSEDILRINDVVTYNDVDGKGTGLWIIDRATVVKETYSSSITLDLTLLHSFMNIHMIRNESSANYKHTIRGIPINKVCKIKIDELAKELLNVGQLYQVCLNFIVERDKDE